MLVVKEFQSKEVGLVGVGPTWGEYDKVGGAAPNTKPLHANTHRLQRNQQSKAEEH